LKYLIKWVEHKEYEICIDTRKTKNKTIIKDFLKFASIMEDENEGFLERMYVVINKNSLHSGEPDVININKNNDREIDAYL